MYISTVLKPIFKTEFLSSPVEGCLRGREDGPVMFTRARHGHIVILRQHGWTAYLWWHHHVPPALLLPLLLLTTWLPHLHPTIVFPLFVHWEKMVCLHLHVAAGLRRGALIGSDRAESRFRIWFARLWVTLGWTFRVPGGRDQTRTERSHIDHFVSVFGSASLWGQKDWRLVGVGGWWPAEVRKSS